MDEKRVDSRNAHHKDNQGHGHAPQQRQPTRFREVANDELVLNPKRNTLSSKNSRLDVHPADEGNQGSDVEQKHTPP